MWLALPVLVAILAAFAFAFALGLGMLLFRREAPRVAEEL